MPRLLSGQVSWADGESQHFYELHVALQLSSSRHRWDPHQASPAQRAPERFGPSPDRRDLPRQQEHDDELYDQPDLAAALDRVVCGSGRGQQDGTDCAGQLSELFLGLPHPSLFSAVCSRLHGSYLLHQKSAAEKGYLARNVRKMEKLELLKNVHKYL